MSFHSDCYYQRQPLTAYDRCDVCVAQARASVLVDYNEEFELLFCRHHFLRNIDAFLAKEYVIYKQFDELED